ncbi:MAG TPA: SRPBCC family protein [Methylomirabilota bacterium]|nr:SRPBCC family protein [Methylomirabilota bacterium]
MQIISSVIVKKRQEDVWKFLADPRNSPQWDRSIAKVLAPAGYPIKIGDIINTTAPSGMKQAFRLTKYTSPNEFVFELIKSTLFKKATLRFLIEKVSEGTRITHDLDLTFRPWTLFLYPILLLTNKKALATDLEYLRRVLDEGYILPGNNKIPKAT